jgi:hypothetical protein
MKKKRRQIRSTTIKKTILVNKDEWKQLLAAVRVLVNDHTKLIKRSKKSEIKEKIVRQQMRNRKRFRKTGLSPKIGSKADQDLSRSPKKKKRSPEFRVCMKCGCEILKYDKYCDNCGNQVA